MGAALVGLSWLPSLPFDASSFDVFTSLGWVQVIGAMFASLSAAVGVSIIVGRLKRSVDFVFTAYAQHALLCTFISGFPWSATWWMVQVVAFLIASSLGEYLCLKREMQDIEVAEMARNAVRAARSRARGEETTGSRREGHASGADGADVSGGPLNRSASSSAGESAAGTRPTPSPFMEAGSVAGHPAADRKAPVASPTVIVLTPSSGSRVGSNLPGAGGGPSSLPQQPFLLSPAALSFGRDTGFPAAAASAAATGAASARSTAAVDLGALALRRRSVTELLSDLNAPSKGFGASSGAASAATPSARVAPAARANASTDLAASLLPPSTASGTAAAFAGGGEQPHQPHQQPRASLWADAPLRGIFSSSAARRSGGSGAGSAAGGQAHNASLQSSAATPSARRTALAATPAAGTATVEASMPSSGSSLTAAQLRPGSAAAGPVASTLGGRRGSFGSAGLPAIAAAAGNTGSSTSAAAAAPLGAARGALGADRLSHAAPVTPFTPFKALVPESYGRGDGDGSIIASARGHGRGESGAGADGAAGPLGVALAISVAAGEPVSGRATSTAPPLQSSRGQFASSAVATTGPSLAVSLRLEEPPIPVALQAATPGALPPLAPPPSAASSRQVTTATNSSVLGPPSSGVSSRQVSSASGRIPVVSAVATPHHPYFAHQHALHRDSHSYGHGHAYSHGHGGYSNSASGTTAHGAGAYSIAIGAAFPITPLASTSTSASSGPASLNEHGEGEGVAISFAPSSASAASLMLSSSSRRVSSSSLGSAGGAVMDDEHRHDHHHHHDADGPWVHPAGLNLALGSLQGTPHSHLPLHLPLSMPHGAAVMASASPADPHLPGHFTLVGAGTLAAGFAGRRSAAPSPAAATAPVALLFASDTGADGSSAPAAVLRPMSRGSR